MKHKKVIFITLYLDNNGSSKKIEQIECDDVVKKVDLDAYRAKKTLEIKKQYGDNYSIDLITTNLY